METGHRAAFILVGMWAVAACSEGDTNIPGDPLNNSTGGVPSTVTPTGGVPAIMSGGTTPAPTGGTAPAPTGGTTPTPTGGATSTGGDELGAGMDASVPDDAEVPDGNGGTPNESSCLDGITNFDSDGPFDYQAMPTGQIKMWIPSVPAGCKVPVIHLANGTGGTCRSYQNVLNRFASHGFLTTCYENGQTGAGTQGVMALEAAFSMYPDLAAKRIGSTGHSQGGQAAFTVLQQAEAKWGDSYTYAGLAMEPASGFGAQPPGGSWQQMYGNIKSPMFMFSGTSDTLVSARWVQQGFDALSGSIEAYNWSAVGATHVPTPQGETMQVGIPWFRWKLLGDKAACEAFKALPNGSDWNSVDEQNVQSCM